MGSREDLDLSEFADSVVRRAGAPSTSRRVCRPPPAVELLERSARGVSSRAVASRACRGRGVPEGRRGSPSETLNARLAAALRRSGDSAFDEAAWPC